MYTHANLNTRAQTHARTYTRTYTHKHASAHTQVGFQKQRPGSASDAKIPALQQAIEACWVHEANLRKSAVEVLNMIAEGDQDMPAPREASPSADDGAKIKLKKAGSFMAALPSKLPPDWEPAVDLQSGKTYYMNHKTRVTQWEFPTE